MTCVVNGCNKPIYYKTAKMCNMHYLRNKRHGNPESGRTPNGESFSFLIKEVAKATPADCQMWPYRKDKNGYARVSTPDCRDALVHRIVCEMMNGSQPSAEMCNVAHSCGKGSSGCFNHFHLRWATYSENERDKIRHGTHNRGERSGRHKLTENEVRMIRYFCESGLLSHSQLSKCFRISMGQISRIRNRIDWGWLK